MFRAIVKAHNLTFFKNTFYFYLPLLSGLATQFCIISVRMCIIKQPVTCQTKSYIEKGYIKTGFVLQTLLCYI